MVFCCSTRLVAVSRSRRKVDSSLWGGCGRGRGERRIRGCSRRYNIRCGVILGISVLEEGREDVFRGIM